MKQTVSYTYRQGAQMRTPLRTVSVRTDERPGCIMAFAHLFIVAFGYACMVAMVYFGWKLLVDPIWHNLLTALGGG